MNREKVILLIMNEHIQELARKELGRELESYELDELRVEMLRTVSRFIKNNLEEIMTPEKQAARF